MSEDAVAGLTMSLFLFVMVVLPWFITGRASRAAEPTSEARLWVALAVLQLAIWSTLGPAERLATAEDGRLLLLLPTVATIAIISVIWTGCRRYGLPNLLELLAAAGLASALGMVLVRSGLPPHERTHLFEYGIVALVAYSALLVRRHSGRRTFHPWPAAFVLASSLGVIDELLQNFVPNRVFDPIDILFNTLSVVLALTSVAVMHGVRKLTGSPRLNR